MKWHIDAKQPIYLQLIRQIERAILSGEYAPGEKLPPVRELAADASVNPNTMQRALGQLEQVGLVHAKRTLGRFVTEDAALIASLKQKMAKGMIEDFLRRMQEMGVSAEEAAELIRSYAAENEKEEKENHNE
ncbi:MAG: GntR family transcriptional regulator [Eubacteriaceae bacterium]|uniref:GntR family transcriptional regulator n=1 Tax=Candidatus Pseudoramibacter fermentans TaxID=2594427 RepID=A0A6L5GST9_9FIRM|nr:GntR family transcriptional regulator [Candidatus Pseudoramibacter fermentans]RRF93026.1 MAG: GntR family transcriptional regulator [Eubacteriaceae bacterium]